MRHGVTKKERSTKRLKYTGGLLGKNLQIKVVLVLDLKDNEIKGQIKAFYWYKIPESNCARK